MDHRHRLDRRAGAATVDRPVDRPFRCPDHLDLRLRPLRNWRGVEPLDRRPWPGHLLRPQPAGGRLGGDLLEQPDLCHPPRPARPQGRGDRDPGSGSIPGNRLRTVPGRTGAQCRTDSRRVRDPVRQRRHTPVAAGVDADAGPARRQRTGPRLDPVHRVPENIASPLAGNRGADAGHFRPLYHRAVRLPDQVRRRHGAGRRRVLTSQPVLHVLRRLGTDTENRVPADTRQVGASQGAADRCGDHVPGHVQFPAGQSRQGAPDLHPRIVVRYRALADVSHLHVSVPGLVPGRRARCRIGSLDGRARHRHDRRGTGVR